MALFEPRGLGWQPSIADFRDYTPGSELVHRLLAQLREAGAASAPTPDSVSLQEFFLAVDDQADLNSSTAHACTALIDYFERRASGRLLRPSRLFVHQNALRLTGASGNAAVDFRAAFKSLIRCGAPPERLWPYRPERLEQQPEAFLYSFREPYLELCYLRLDSRDHSGRANLLMAKSFLAAGFPLVLGLGVPNSLTGEGEIPFRPTFDSILGGQALVAVGYDDDYLQSTRGALLVRSSWGADWGMDGYGWLPYAFVEEQLVGEFWTLLHPRWMDSGEFDLPLLP